MYKTKVIILGVIAAALYGVVHDQITIRLCPEYFTIAHPPIFRTTSLTLLAVGWGIAATVWLGAALGVMLARVSHSEGFPPVSIRHLSLYIALLLGVMAVLAVFAGIVGFQLSRHGMISVPIAVEQVIPLAKQSWFMAVWFAHIASYVLAVIGGALLIYRIWRDRGRPQVMALLPATRVGVMRVIALTAIVVAIIYIRVTAS